MNRFGGAEDNTSPKASKGKKDYGTPKSQAEKATYHEDGEVYVPSSWLISSIRNAAGLFKSPGKRSSLKNTAGSALVCPEEKIFIHQTLKDIEVDSRGAVIQRARIVRHRPKFSEWELEFSLMIDEDLLDTKTVEAIIIEAGRSQGIGDYRLNKGGPFGSFEVVSVK